MAGIATSKTANKVAYLEALEILSDSDDLSRVFMANGGLVSQGLFACMAPKQDLKL